MSVVGFSCECVFGWAFVCLCFTMCWCVCRGRGSAGLMARPSGWGAGDP